VKFEARLVRVDGQRRRIRAVSGSGDTPAALGGDEFALLLEDRGGVDRSLDVADMLLDMLLDMLREPVSLAGYDLAVLASVGVAVATPGMTPRVSCATPTSQCTKRSGRARGRSRSSIRRCVLVPRNTWSFAASRATRSDTASCGWCSNRRSIKQR
jgi:hypothetical protein